VLFQGLETTPLTGSDLLKECVLSREVVQNNTDAEMDNAKVKIAFNRLSIGAVRLLQLRELLGSQDGPLARFENLGLKEGNAFRRLIDGDDESTELLFVEDWNTLGLGGSLREGETDENRFRKLILLLGLEDRPDHARPGGWFGYGRTVYSGPEDVRTIAYYSALRHRTQGSSLNRWGAVQHRSDSSNPWTQRRGARHRNRCSVKD